MIKPEVEVKQHGDLGLATLSKKLELPPEVAKAFIKDMRAFYAEPNAIKRDEIASGCRHLRITHGPLLALRGGDRCSGRIDFFAPLQKALKQLMGLIVSSRFAWR
jgi:hypothetical protein